jgi:hypothetical protein
MMGPAHGDPEQRPVSDVFMELANKAGYEVIVPQVRRGSRDRRRQGSRQQKGHAEEAGASDKGSRGRTRAGVGEPQV